MRRRRIRIGKDVFMEHNISGMKDSIGKQIQQFIGFLTNTIANKNSRNSSRLKFVSVRLRYCSKTQATKCSKVRK